MDTLPAELISHICSSLCDGDLINFRLTSKFAYHSSIYRFSRRFFSWFYFDFRPASLDRLEGISQHDTFRKHVRCIGFGPPSCSLQQGWKAGPDSLWSLVTLSGGCDRTADTNPIITRIRANPIITRIRSAFLRLPRLQDVSIINEWPSPETDDMVVPFVQDTVSFLLPAIADMDTPRPLDGSEIDVDNPLSRKDHPMHLGAVDHAAPWCSKKLPTLNLVWDANTLHPAMLDLIRCTHSLRRLYLANLISDLCEALTRLETFPPLEVLVVASTFYDIPLSHLGSMVSRAAPTLRHLMVSGATFPEGLSDWQLVLEEWAASLKQLESISLGHIELEAYDDYEPTPNVMYNGILTENWDDAPCRGQLRFTVNGPRGVYGLQYEGRNEDVLRVLKKVGCAAQLCGPYDDGAGEGVKDEYRIGGGLLARRCRELSIPKDLESEFGEEEPL